MFVLAQATFQRVQRLWHAVFRVRRSVGRSRRCALDRFASFAVTAALAARIVGGGAENNAEAIFARRAVAAAHVAVVVLAGTVAHATAIGAGRAVAVAHVAAIVSGRAVWRAGAVEASRVARWVVGRATDVALIVGGIRADDAVARQARSAVTVAHVALIVDSRAVWRAGAIRAGRVAQRRLRGRAADVAAIVRGAAVRHTIAISTARAVTATDATGIDSKAREWHASQLTASREEIFTDTIVLERAHERGNVKEPLVGTVQVDGFEAGSSEERVQVRDRPFDVRALSGRRRIVVDWRHRLKSDIRQLVAEALVQFVQASAVVRVQAKASDVKHLLSSVTWEAL